MSYILDALKHSDKQRPSEQISIPPLPDQETQRSGISRWIIIPVFCLLLVLLFFLLPASESTINAQPARPVIVVQQENSPSEEQALLGVRIQLTEPEPVKKNVERQPPITATETTAEVVTVNTVTPAVKAPLPEAVSIKTEKPVTQSEPKSTEEQQEQLPYWRQLPADVQRGINDLNFTVHIFARDPANRMVKINGQVFRQGQQINNGLLLDEITREGVILQYRGYRFRMNPV